MAPTIPTREPAVFTAGETVKWSISDSTYPASAGTLAYFFVNSGGSFTETSSTADGDTHQIVISATDSSVTAGTYSWQARYTVTATSEEYVIGEGTTVVKPEFTDTAYDNRTTAKQALDAIEAVIINLAGQDYSSMSVRDRSTTKKELSAALVERDRLKSEVAREIAAEKIAAGLGNPGKVRVRF